MFDEWKKGCKANFFMIEVIVSVFYLIYYMRVVPLSHLQSNFTSLTTMRAVLPVIRWWAVHLLM